MNNLTNGKHSLTVKADKIVVESNFGRESMISTFSLTEYAKAHDCFKQLTGNQLFTIESVVVKAPKMTTKEIKAGERAEARANAKLSKALGHKVTNVGR